MINLRYAENVEEKKVKQPTRLQIRRFIDRSELSWEDIADRIPGTTVRAIRSWHSGKRRCKPVMWWALNKILNDVDLRTPEDKK